MDEAPVAWRVVAVGAVTKVAFHLATARLWGLHRDEFYYLAGGRHPAWGYVDHPPVTPMLYRLGSALFGTSQLGLRVLPALFGGVIVVLAALLAREFGGGRWAQGVAVLIAWLGPLYLTTAHFLSTVTVDIVCWGLASLLVVRLLRTGRLWLWAVVGVVVGVGLLNKHTMAFWVVGVGIGLLSTPYRRVLWSWWAALGGLVAVALFTPNLLWQAHHGWATLTFARNLRARTGGQNLALFIPVQLGIVTIAGTAVWVAGLRAAFREGEWRSMRFLGIAWAVLFVVLFASGGKGYYLGSLYLPLVGLGATVLERSAGGVRPGRLMGAVIGTGLLTLPVFTPVFPASWAATVPLQKANDDLSAMLGWHTYARQVAAAYRRLPASVQGRTVILGHTYFEAGAVEYWRSSLSRSTGAGPGPALPHPISPHNSYWWWGYGSARVGDTVLAGGYRVDELTRWFAGCRQVGVSHAPHDLMDDQVRGLPLVACRAVRPWSGVWREMRLYT